MSIVRRVAMTTAVAGTSCIAWGTLVERNWYALRRYTVPVLPADAPPLRILHVSDLHLVPRQRRRIEWVQQLAGLEPDYVVNTGDNCSDLDAIPAVLEAFAPLMEGPGAFVLGSNDYFGPKPKNPARYLGNRQRRAHQQRSVELPVQDLVDGFTGAGWTDLDNRRTQVEVRGLPIELVGTNDPHLEYDRYDEVSAPASTETALTMGIVHAPYTRVLDPMARDGADVILAGHTHGGQLAVPFYGALVTNCDLDTSRAKGLSRWWPGANGKPSSQAPVDAAWLHVSAGLGHSKYAPARFACRPEASLITLLPRSS